MADEFCMLHILAKIKKKPTQHKTHHLRLTLMPLKQDTVLLAGKMTKGNTVWCHHCLTLIIFPATEPLLHPEGVA